MTTEQKLAAVIEAQTQGGYPRWDLLLGLAFDEDCIYFTPSPVEPEERYVIIELLLNREGLKAAYGNDTCLYSFDGIHATGEELETWFWVGRAISNAWLSGGSDSAIETAYDLLPNK